MTHDGLFLASLPTSEKIFGVYGAVWLMLLIAVATAVFLRRMYHLLRILALGRRENRAGPRRRAHRAVPQGSPGPVADVGGRLDHQLGPPVDLLGLLLLRGRLGADVPRRHARSVSASPG